MISQSQLSQAGAHASYGYPSVAPIPFNLSPTVTNSHIVQGPPQYFDSQYVYDGRLYNGQDLGQQPMTLSQPMYSSYGMGYGNQLEPQYLSPAQLDPRFEEEIEDEDHRTAEEEMESEVQEELQYRQPGPAQGQAGLESSLHEVQVDRRHSKHSEDDGFSDFPLENGPEVVAARYAESQRQEQLQMETGLWDTEWSTMVFLIGACCMPPFLLYNLLFCYSSSTGARIIARISQLLFVFYAIVFVMVMAVLAATDKF